ncbi:MAG: hypothetical protein IJT34_11355 [Butyrivibrio sp.]|nr:hypothetical protein [Butyrivibrio sp.]
MYYEYDEELEEYSCSSLVEMDEDDYGRMVADPRAACPMFRAGNEYQIVKKQL